MNNKELRRAKAIEEALKTVLDQVDYMRGNCVINEAVGAVLSPIVIRKARLSLVGKFSK